MKATGKSFAITDFKRKKEKFNVLSQLIQAKNMQLPLSFEQDS